MGKYIHINATEKAKKTEASRPLSKLSKAEKKPKTGLIIANEKFSRLYLFIQNSISRCT